MKKPLLLYLIPLSSLSLFLSSILFKNIHSFLFFIFSFFLSCFLSKNIPPFPCPFNSFIFSLFLSLSLSLLLSFQKHPSFPTSLLKQSLSDNNNNRSPLASRRSNNSCLSCGDCTKLAAANTFALFPEHFSLSCYLWKQQFFSQLLHVETTAFLSAVICGNNSFFLCC